MFGPLQLRVTRSLGEIMKTISPIALICLTLVVAGCTGSYWGYGKRDWRGIGYSDQQIDHNTFFVSYKGNASASRPTVETYLLRRCAEVTLAAGYDYFVIVSTNSSEQVVPFTIPGSSTSQSTGSAQVYGNSIYGSSTTTTSYTPPQVLAFSLPQVSTTIKGFHGEKPNDSAVAYDAREVMKYVGPQAKR